MKFLNTEGRMEVVEFNDFTTVEIKLFSSYFDLKPLKFVEKLTKVFSDVKKVSGPILIKLNCEELTEDEIDYFKDFILNTMVDIFKDGEPVNDWWSARTEILDKVGISATGLKKLSNYAVSPQVFTIVFDKSGKMCYNILEK